MQLRHSKRVLQTGMPELLSDMLLLTTPGSDAVVEAAT